MFPEEVTRFDEQTEDNQRRNGSDGKQDDKRNAKFCK
jgi:hypothetical protein